uniref:Uncharacterized protein n=1 Tax=Solanum tuberosum TaxID=4113 RepID=M1BWQ1_SOLTU
MLSKVFHLAGARWFEQRRCCRLRFRSFSSRWLHQSLAGVVCCWSLPDLFGACCCCWLSELLLLLVGDLLSGGVVVTGWNCWWLSSPVGAAARWLWLLLVLLVAGRSCWSEQLLLLLAERGENGEEARGEMETSGCLLVVAIFAGDGWEGERERGDC